MKFLMFLLVVLAITACGRKGYDGLLSDNCSSEFILDYNRIAGRTISKFTAAEIKSLAENMKTKYAGVKCRASVRRFGELDEHTTTIDTEADMNMVIGQANSILK